VILDFWATTCGPCIIELGVLQKAYAARYGADPKVEFVAISTDTDKPLVAPFAEKHGYTFPVLLTDGTIETPYGCETTIPQLYVIDPEGRIRFHHEGYLADGFLERLDWMIEAAALPHPNPPRQRR
jgi:peroxiredoxin